MSESLVERSRRNRPRSASRRAALPLAVALAFALGLLIALGGCASTGTHAETATRTTLSARETAFLDTLEHRTFLWFWERCHPNGLTPDRWPTPSFVSMGATGFALTAYPIGAERGWVTRREAARRTLTTLRFLWSARQDTAVAGSSGTRGFFYHFVDSTTGHRFETVELSTVDTALLMAGALFCQSYFEKHDAVEDSIRMLAESLYVRVDWRWAQIRPPTISLGWSPESGHLPYDWRGYNEALILHVLALGSPRHPVETAAWQAWTSGYRWGVSYGLEQVGFAPLFGHQYSYVWIDPRGIRDEYMRARGIDYFENSRRATLAQRAYAIENPSGFDGYGEELWGLSACDGPADTSFVLNGRARTFRTYAARGVSFTEIVDDGTITPTAAAGSIAFAPEVVAPMLVAMRERYGARVFGRYGFVDALNPSLREPIRVHHGVVDPALGWFDLDYLGIDQGPILAMIENQRSGLVWRTMRRNPHLRRGLERAGFTGGWLDSGSGR